MVAFTHSLDPAIEGEKGGKRKKKDEGKEGRKGGEREEEVRKEEGDK